jgi:hypothetical protein
MMMMMMMMIMIIIIIIIIINANGVFRDIMSYGFRVKANI